MAIVVVRYKTTASTRRALSFIVRAFFDDTITVAVWTGFHVRLMRMLPHPSNGRATMDGMMQMQCYSLCFADPAVANSLAAVFDASDQAMSALPPKADIVHDAEVTLIR